MWLKSKIVSFLFFTQKFTQLDHLYFAKGGFWIFLANTISVGLGVLSTVAFTRLSTKEIFGQYQLLLAMIDTVWFFSLPGINVALMSAVAKGEEKSFFVALREKFRFSLLGSLVFLASSLYFYALRDNIVFAKAALVVGILFPIHTVFGLIFSYYNAKKEFRTPSLYQIFVRVVTVLGVVSAIVVWNNLIAIISVYLLVNSLAHLALFFDFRQREKFSGGIDQGVVPYGRKLTLVNLVPEVLNNLDRLILTWFLGVEALAIYVIALKIPDLLKGFLKSLDALVFPKMVNVGKEALIGKLKNLNLLTIFLFVTLLTITVIPFLASLLFGKEYQAAHLPAQVYALALIPFFLHHTLSNWFQAQRYIREYFYLTNFFYIGNVLLIIIFLLLRRDVLSVVTARVVINTAALAFGLYLLSKSRKAAEVK